MRSMRRDDFFILTGGPGSGKTTLIDDLRAERYATAPEAGRAIIRAQNAIDGPARPDKNPALYAELMLCWEMRSYEAGLEQQGPVFFDRGVPDVLGYLRLMRLPVPPHMHRAAEKFRYSETVFICPPWVEIYAQDGERKQSLDEAMRTFEALRDTYMELGYRLVEVPLAPVAQRREFICSTVSVVK